MKFRIKMLRPDGTILDDDILTEKEFPEWFQHHIEYHDMTVVGKADTVHDVMSDLAEGKTRHFRNGLTLFKAKLLKEEKTKI